MEVHRQEAEPWRVTLVDTGECTATGGRLKGVAERGELQAYRPRGFWGPMDSLRDCTKLEAHWASGRAPWKLW